MSWKSVAICDEHWKEQEGDRVPIRLSPMSIPDPCYLCGKPSDIFTRREIK